jgi:hypothetical protein
MEEFVKRWYIKNDKILCDKNRPDRNMLGLG